MNTSPEQALEERRQEERRQHGRVALYDSPTSVTLSLYANDSLAVPVLNLSAGGAMVRASEPPPWANGQTDLSLRISDESIIPCRAQIARAGAAHNGALYGLQLAFKPQHRAAAARAYHRLRFPLLARRHEIEPRMLLDLLADSGYLKLKSDITPSDAWLAAGWPSTLSHDAVYTATDGRVLGHVTVTRAYPRAWLGHEIATLRNHPEARDCRRTLYHHFTAWPRLLDGKDAHLLGYYNRARPWHQVMFEDFAKECAPQECSVLHLDRYVAVPLPPALPAPAGPKSPVEAVDPTEEAAIVQLIGRWWPDLALEAFDIADQRLTTASMHPAYREANFRRGRYVLGLRAERKWVAAGLCEWSDSGISLFNTLNLAQVFVDPQADLPNGACAALLTAIRRFYAQRGLPPPLVVCPPGTLARWPIAGIRHVETMGCIIWNARALHRFEGYVEAMLKPRTAAGHSRRGTV